MQTEAEGKQDKSKPHAKLTAIEHLLKDEIEASVGSKLSQNQDLTVVDIDEAVGSQPSKRSAKKVQKEEEEEYWSDFSDDDYTQEINEEKKASEVLLSLQRWIYNSNLESELKGKYHSRDIITLDEFKDALNEGGYYCELLDLQALLKRLDIVDNSGINYKVFLNNILERNAAWWKESLSNNSFDITGKGKRNGNYRPLCSKPIYDFISNNLGDKAKQAINKAGYLSPHEFVEELESSSTQGLTKRELRQQFLEKNIALTRLETHLLYKTLEDPSTNLVLFSDFKRYLDDSHEYVIAKGLDRVGAASQIWIEEEVQDGVTVPQSSQYDPQLKTLQEYVLKNKINVEEKLTALDKQNKGILNRQIFLNFCKENQVPLTTLEQKGLFSEIVEQHKGKLTIADLSTLLSGKVSKPGTAPSKPKVNPTNPVKPDVASKVVDSKTELKIKELEENIKEKNKLIISLQKDLTELKNVPSVDNSKEVAKLEKENRDLNRLLKEGEQKYTRDKKKLEQLIKENISTPEAGDFILLQKKIEYLEQSMYDREHELKKSFRTSFNTKDRQEINQLKQQIDSERVYYNNVIDKKNMEIKMFRDELEILLKELEDVKNQQIEKERLFMNHKSNLIPK